MLTWEVLLDVLLPGDKSPHLLFASHWSKQPTSTWIPVTKPISAKGLWFLLTTHAFSITIIFCHLKDFSYNRFFPPLIAIRRQHFFPSLSSPCFCTKRRVELPCPHNYYSFSPGECLHEGPPTHTATSISTLALTTSSEAAQLVTLAKDTSVFLHR